MFDVSKIVFKIIIIIMKNNKMWFICGILSVYQFLFNYRRRLEEMQFWKVGGHSCNFFKEKKWRKKFEESRCTENMCLVI